MKIEEGKIYIDFDGLHISFVNIEEDKGLPGTWFGSDGKMYECDGESWETMRKIQGTFVQHPTTRPMKNHDLKTLPDMLRRVVTGRKTVELRINDRDFQVGDVLTLRGFEEGLYNGTVAHVRVTDIVEGGQFGLKVGYVAMSIKKLFGR